MERIIKFRAWDKKLKKFHSDINEGYDNRIFQLFLNLSGQKILRGKEEGGDINSMSCINKYQERFEINQYTGLKDKNGREIYEGDIVEWSGGIYSEVYWDNDDVGFSLKSNNKQFSLDNDGIIDDMQVIGNIYENPELLNK